MSTTTAHHRRERPLAAREPLGPWAVWVRQQRQDHGWSEADLVSVLWGQTSDSQVREVRRWEAGHWSPADEARQRLVSAFGTTPAGLDAPITAHGTNTDASVPARAAIADTLTDARASLNPYSDSDTYHRDTTGRPAHGADGEVVDLSDLDGDLPDPDTTAHHDGLADDEDRWEL